MNGIINVFKPRGLTSNDVVKRVKKILNVKKVGHTGTLDPNASGVLPICIGKATRVSEYLLYSNKRYIAEITLGFSTDTQDEEGNILNHSEKEVAQNEILEAFASFKGEIYQIPPMYSALKYSGKRLYELAREGIEVEREKRKVYIYDLEILKIIDNRKILFSVECSRGTYIRTLCNDIGEYLGTYGYMSFLIRTSVYPFKLDNAVSLETIKNKFDSGKIQDILLPVDYALSNLKSIFVDRKYFKQLSNGMFIELNRLNFKGNLVIGENLRIYCGDIFIGIGKFVDKDGKIFLKMNKVFL